MAEERKVPREGGSRTFNRDGVEIEPIAVPIPKPETKVKPKPEAEMDTKPIATVASAKTTKKKPK